MSEGMRNRIQAAATPGFIPVRSGLLQRKCACGGAPGLTGECDECGQKRMTFQRQTNGRSESSTAPPIVHDVLSSSGQPLDAATRAFMEPRFGHDFSQVRVHTDAKAGESARALSALAYTVGRDIVFEAGQYSPSTVSGRELLSHELAHAVQHPPAGAPSTELSVAPANDPMELEAEDLSRSVMRERISGPGSSVAIGQTPGRAHYIYRCQQFRPAGSGGGTAPARRIIYLDANIFDQINRGNQAAATALQQLRTSGADLVVSHWTQSEMLDRPAIPRTAAANRLMIQDLGIRTDSAVPFSQRAELGMANQRPGGATVISPPDAQVAIGARAGGGEIWSFDTAFRNNPQNIRATFGLSVAPESHLPLAPHGSVADYRVGRRLLSLPAVEISLSGAVRVRGGPGGGTGGGSSPSGGSRQGPPPSGGAAARQAGTGGGAAVTETVAGRGASVRPIVPPSATVAARVPAAASAAMVLERNALIGALEQQTRRSAAFATRLGAYVNLAGHLLSALEMLNAVSDILSMAEEGTVLSDAQRTADRVVEQANDARAQAQITYDSISLLTATAQVDDALRRTDTAVLFDLSGVLVGFGREVNDQAFSYAELARDLNARSRALNRLSDLFARLVETPQGFSTAPQASALAQHLSLQRLSSTLANAAARYDEARVLLRYLADFTVGLGSRANQGAWKQILSDVVRQVAEAERQQQQPPSQPPAAVAGPPANGQQAR